MPARLGGLVRRDEGAHGRRDRRHGRGDRCDLPCARAAPAAARAGRPQPLAGIQRAVAAAVASGEQDERGTRIVAIVGSLVAHLFFAVFLLYVAYVPILALPRGAARETGRVPIRDKGG